jgi:light-regulated signal transduction histidine kinase (bacteriophytochrome)
MTLRAASFVAGVPPVRGSVRAKRRQALPRGREKIDMSETDLLQKRIDQLEQRIEELDAFASSVSHDLHAPLRTVHSYARILEEDHAAEMTPAARACVERIVRGTRDMGNLIDELLALSRFDSEPVSMSLVNTRALVERVLGELIPEGTDRIRPLVGALGHCLGNPRLLQQVWVNLLSNALKFTRDRDPALIEIGSNAKDDIITYFVRDNGVGFDSINTRDLFMPFRQFHDRRDYEGQGLGLSIARRIVSRHGGRIWAESRRGEGAAFYFTLPRS